jgi:hypothetical protein
VCGEAIHIKQTKHEYLTLIILPQNKANVETYSHPKKAPIIVHHPHALLEILIICHNLTNKMPNGTQYEKTKKIQIIIEGDYMNLYLIKFKVKWGCGTHNGG